ncbi:MAG: Crp/Fnr family transcriptional regulator [Synechococcaceae cyanobacterium RL_1_2]|nr:Crp/Fnr family transcriptional regulator [Synechococcaceae cyanobacterium RL_1_2]
MNKQGVDPPHSMLIQQLIHHNFLFRGLDPGEMEVLWAQDGPIAEKLYSSRPIFTAFRPHQSLEFLYAIVEGGPVVMRSTPLDRIIAMTYPGSCFGMRNLPLGVDLVCRSFPSLVEAYKTTDVIKIPLNAIATLYQGNVDFKTKYDFLCELREKFHYHLLNCSSYPPQAVAALFRAVIYQERSLENQPNKDGYYLLDLPVDIISHSCQLNHRTVEQVLKAMTKAGLIELCKTEDGHNDLIQLNDPEALKEVYGATRSKVSWWPLK